MIWKGFIVICLSALMMTGCSTLTFLQKKKPVVMPPQIGKIQIPQNEELQKVIHEEVTGYRELRPGLKQVFVRKSGGFFFDGDKFRWFMYRDSLRSHYILWLENAIGKHNKFVEELVKKAKKELAK